MSLFNLIARMTLDTLQFRTALKGSEHAADYAGRSMERSFTRAAAKMSSLIFGAQSINAFINNLSTIGKSAEEVNKKLAEQGVKPRPGESEDLAFAGALKEVTKGRTETSFAGFAAVWQSGRSILLQAFNLIVDFGAVVGKTTTDVLLLKQNLLTAPGAVATGARGALAFRAGELEANIKRAYEMVYGMTPEAAKEQSKVTESADARILKQILEDVKKEAARTADNTENLNVGL